MEIWDDIVKKLTNAADYTIKEAEKLTSTAKLKFSIIDEENRLQSLYAMVGKRYYDSLKDSEEILEEYKAAFAEIKAKYEALEKMYEEQAASKNCNICPGCKSKVANDAAYCSVCGLKQKNN